MDVAVDFRDYVEYESKDDKDGWIVLSKPKPETRTMNGGHRPHPVCVVNAGGHGKEVPIKMDGSGITFEDSVVKMVQSSLRRLHQNLGHPQGEDLLSPQPASPRDQVCEGHEV